MVSKLELRELFLHELRSRWGWANTGHLVYCDRCGGPSSEAIYLGDPPDILLVLCAGCTEHVHVTMRSPGSGYLGTAWTTARALADGIDVSQARAAALRSKAKA